jgi:transcriptional regulator with XRE-family HTH domain
MSNPNRSVKAATTKHHNRVAAIMLHTSRYSCYPTSRLAADSGVAKSTISKLLHGRTNPLYSTAARVVKCLEAVTGLRLDFREVFAEAGLYPTPYVCGLVGCPGCTPEIVYDRQNDRRPAFDLVRPGQWSGDTSEFDLISEAERSE